MKKTIFYIVFFMFVFSFQLVAQNSSLYDVNYDKPKNTVQYDEANEIFQKIFLQYEHAITKKNEIIRQVEKERYFKEIENIKRKEKERAENEIEEMRCKIYANEVENVRNQEIQRLTSELTEKITKELNTKFASEYEKKKNQEISKLYKSLKKEAYKETEATTKRFKYVANAASKILIICLLVVTIFFIIRTIYRFVNCQIQISRKKREEAERKQKEENYKKEQYEALVTEYRIKLKDYNGNSSPILYEIEETYEKNKYEKNIRIKALKDAINTYVGDIPELQDYKDKFSQYKMKFTNCMKGWKNNNIQQVFGLIKDCKREYEKAAHELYNSIEFRNTTEKQQAKNILQEVANELEDFYKEIENKELEKGFAKDRKELVESFKELVKKIEKGEF